jgi:hypothetical protein
MVIVNFIIIALLLNPSLLAASTLLDNFEKYREGVFRAQWRAKNSDAQTTYRSDNESGKPFLHAQSNSQGVRLALERIVDPKDLRRLASRWRVRTFPNGADERIGAKHDAAAQIYVIFDNQNRNMK